MSGFFSSGSAIGFVGGRFCAAAGATEGELRGGETEGALRGGGTDGALRGGDGAIDGELRRDDGAIDETTAFDGASLMRFVIGPAGSLTGALGGPLCMVSSPIPPLLGGPL
jgi:hypothetical protein